MIGKRLIKIKKKSGLLRVEDWRELLIGAARPSVELKRFKKNGELSAHPELLALAGCKQDPVWHPEGDAWEHTLLSLDSFAAERLGDELEDYPVGLAVLCHDLGKPAATRTHEGRIVSRGHEGTGVAPTRSFLTRIGIAPQNIEEIIYLVLCHMRPEQLYNARSGDSAVRRLARAVGGRLDRLVRVCRADKGGRGRSGKPDFPAGEWVIEKYRETENPR
ncbi:MAG: hypothetical protein AAB359_04880 [Elusimicrobiota bacterium]